jgi:intracellular septation protein
MSLKELTKTGPSLNIMLFKFLTELGPVGIFFVTNLKFGFFKGTAAFMISTVVSLIASLVVLRKVPVVPLITAVFVISLGALTLILEDTTFMKLKPTLLNLCFATLLLGGLASGRLFLKTVFGEFLLIEEEGWRKLTIRWGGFFILLAVLNELVWRSVSDDTWVLFKFVGIFPLTLIFSALQFPLIQRYQISSEEDAGQPPEAA